MKKEREEQESKSLKPIRNIFKMSRQLVSATKAFQKPLKGNAQLAKVNEADLGGKKVKHDDDKSSSEHEYSISSESNDDD